MEAWIVATVGNDSLDADHVASVGVGEDLEDEVVDAEGLDADLGLDGVLAHAAEDVVGDGLEQDLALGADVSAHRLENMAVVVQTSEIVLHREYIF